jgi:periplasmic protein TonB
MDFSRRQRDPRRHLIGIAFVVLFHLLIVYALLTGLAKKIVDVVRAPIETKVIEEIKKPPPPQPEIVVPPPPKLEAPPPPYIPPPEVVLATPPPPVPTIAVAPTPTPPPAPVELAPVAPPVQAPVAAAPPPPTPPAPPPPKPAVASIGSICTKQTKPDLPSIDYVGNAIVLVKYTIVGGKVTKIDVVKESYVPNIDRKAKRAVFAAIESAALEYSCTGDHVDVTQEFAFRLN